LRLKPVGQHAGVKICTAFPDQCKQVCAIPVANGHVEEPVQGMVCDSGKHAQPFQRTRWQQKSERFLTFQPAYVRGFVAVGELSFDVLCYECVCVGLVAKKRYIDCFLEPLAFTLTAPIVSTDICSDRSKDAPINL
jgi:hypothetical protein